MTTIVQLRSPAILSRIHEVRGMKVMFDQDLAELYDVSTGQLNQAVKRNPDRFPVDFCFSLTAKEMVNLKSQRVISSSWGGRRKPVVAFTEHGI